MLEEDSLEMNYQESGHLKSEIIKRKSTPKESEEEMKPINDNHSTSDQLGIDRCGSFDLMRKIDFAS